MNIIKALCFCTLLLIAGPAQTQGRAVGSPNFDKPGAIWVDYDSDGHVDGYVHSGQYYPDAPSAGTAPPEAATKTLVPAAIPAPIPAEPDKKWGALVQLVGKSWYCVGSNPSQWIARKRIESGYGFSYNRSPPVVRLTTAEWLQPFSSLKVTTVLGDGRRWVDTISLQNDGSFLMVTEGVQAFSKVRGYSDGWTITFPLGKYDTNQNKLTFGGYQSIPVYELASGTFGDDARCFMQIVDTPESAEQFKKSFLDAQRDFDEKSSRIPSIEADMANDRAAGEQMRANMQSSFIGTIASGGGGSPVAYFPNTSSISGSTGSSFYDQLTAMADQAHREAEQSRLRLDQSIAGGLAGQGGSGPADGRSSAPNYTPPPASSAPPQAPGQPAFQLSKPTESYCSYWHRPRAGDREYEQCSPGDENCTCADAAKVSPQ